MEPCIHPITRYFIPLIKNGQICCLFSINPLQNDKYQILYNMVKIRMIEQTFQEGGRYGEGGQLEKDSSFFMKKAIPFPEWLRKCKKKYSLDKCVCFQDVT